MSWKRLEVYIRLLLLCCLACSITVESQETAKRAGGSPEQTRIISRTGGQLLNREDVGGVLPLLLSVSGYAAMERGSELIEPRDMLRAIYVVDLEHVSKFWDDWEGFERLVSKAKLANGAQESYLNRTLYLFEVQELMKREPGTAIEFGRASKPLLDIVAAARKTATNREDSATPSSKDLLYAICSHDTELGAALKASGLATDKLAESVFGPRH